MFAEQASSSGVLGGGGGGDYIYNYYLCQTKRLRYRYITGTPSAPLED